LVTDVAKTKKALYRHKKTGDLFSIETDEDGKVGGRTPAEPRAGLVADYSRYEFESKL